MEMETNGNVKWDENATWIYYLSEICKSHHSGIYKKFSESWKIKELKIHLLSQKKSEGKWTPPVGDTGLVLKIWLTSKWQGLSTSLRSERFLWWGTKTRSIQIQPQQIQTTQPAFQMNLFCRCTGVAKNIQD